MPFSFTKISVVALSIFSTLALTNEFARSLPNEVTTFRCLTQGSGYATVAQRGDRTTDPIITWNSTAFGPEFTPQRRCEIVSDRLSKAVAANGGKLRNLRLTHGTVKSSPVICYINTPDEECNADNLLLTLNQSDRGKEAQILKQLDDFGINGTGVAISRGRTVVYLGIQVETSLGTGGTTTTPQPTNMPVVRPQNPSSSQPSSRSSTTPTITPSTKPAVDNSL